MYVNKINDFGHNDDQLQLQAVPINNHTKHMFFGSLRYYIIKKKHERYNVECD